MRFKIATPERIMLETEIDSLTLPTQKGEITILPNHIPLVSNLVPGEIRYKVKGEQNFFSVSGGVIQVKKNNEVVVLADAAEFGHEIDITRAEEARDRAKKIMASAYKEEKTFISAAIQLEKNLTRIKVARKHRTHTHKNLESGVMPK